ncbi:flagellar assembly peptidoglycan hydrolase FlgJ [Corallincola platygyrae]|uniref:Peptidoglycan hydrolase FlgJ n=1 Tax=Corallincola platygyrae TaxID=1193278 RepID=A0ABW4XIH2_9GAMM
MIDSDRFATSRQVHDIQGLDRLRQSAQKNEDAALHEVAKQFEGMFVQMLISSMRQANEAFESDSPFNSRYAKFYENMADQQMSQDLSQSGAFGLAEIMVQQLRPDGKSFMPSSAVRSTADSNLGNDQMVTSLAGGNLSGILSGSKEGKGLPLDQYMRAGVPQVNRGEAAVDVVKLSTPATEQKAAAKESSTVTGFLESVDFSSPQAFVQSVMPYAEKAAKALGTSPTVLIAQAALETGWGQKAIKRLDGSSSNNLFNIKADQRWSGDSVSVNTLEYEQGVAVKERAAFRAYDSVAASFNDFVEFLQNSPRYQDAINQSSNSASFLQELQKAGYATDPRYADKVMGVLKQVNSLL